MANDFSKDSSVKALWRLESGALTVDSISTNTLTNNGVTSDTSDYKEGAGCGIIEGTANYLTILDANLCAGFPLKSGDSTKQGTWCCWFKLVSSITGFQVILANAAWNGGGTCIFLGFKLQTQELRVAWGYGTVQQQEEWLPGFTPSINTWYHIGIAFDGINQLMGIRLWDGATVHTYSHTFGDPLAIRGNPFNIGYDPTDGWNSFPGKIDEVVIFNRILSNTEIDYIRQQIFGASSTRNLTTVCVAVSAVSTPILAVTRSLTSSPAAVSATSTPNLAVQRALATLAAALSATSDINLSTNAIRDLVTTCAAQSQTSNPVLGVARPLNSSMAAQTQTSAIILAILRVLTTTLSARTYTPDTILKVLRSLVTTIAAQSTVSSPVLTMLHRLVTVAAAGTSTSAVALAVLRPLVATIAAQTATSDVVLRTSPYLDLTTICAALTQTSDIDLILTFYESLLSKAKRFYGPVSAADLEAAALQWLETEPATLLPAALQWVVVGEEKEENQ